LLVNYFNLKNVPASIIIPFRNNCGLFNATNLGLNYLDGQSIQVVLIKKGLSIENLLDLNQDLIIKISKFYYLFYLKAINIKNINNLNKIDSASFNITSTAESIKSNRVLQIQLKLMKKSIQAYSRSLGFNISKNNKSLFLFI